MTNRANTLNVCYSDFFQCIINAYKIYNNYDHLNMYVEPIKK